MSETKWTPGPWESDGTRIWAGRKCILVAHSLDNTEEERANTTIATAATDLYEALEAIDKSWELGGFAGPEDPRAQARFTDQTVAAWRNIRAALAKARGEA